MRKISIYSLALLFAGSFAACSDENINSAADVADANSEITFSISKEAFSNSSLGKTAYSGEDIVWTGNEGFSVFPVGSKILGEHDLFYISKTSDDKKSCQIKGNATMKETYYCLYPYDADAKLEGVTMTVNFPREQTAQEGQFDPKADLMVASTSLRDANFSFKHVGAKLAVTVGDGVKQIVVSSKNYKPLSGDGVKLTLDNDGVPTVGEIANPYFNVTLTTDGTAGTYYVSVLPVEATDVEVYAYTEPDVENWEFGNYYKAAGLTFARNAKYTMNLASEKAVNNAHKIGDLVSKVNISTDDNYYVFVANQNLGASSATEAGDYFAWGEISPKDNYNRIILPTESEWNSNINDAAFVNIGGSFTSQFWRMPKMSELNMVSQIFNKINRSNSSYAVCSDNNGNDLIIPYCGRRQGMSSPSPKTLTTFYCEIDCKYYLRISTKDPLTVYDNAGYVREGYGFPIRPVFVIKK